jgi:hypothetical protein
MVNYLGMPSPPTEERDITLGQYMYIWSKLEFQLLLLFHLLSDTTMEIAGIIFSTGFQCPILVSMFKALGKIRLLDSEYQKLTGLCRRYSRANEKRNRIVHGSWIREANSSSPMHYQWTRIYLPINSIIANEIFNKINQEVRRKYRFTIPQLKEATEQLNSLINDVQDLNHLLMARLEPDFHDGGE